MTEPEKPEVECNPEEKEKTPIEKLRRIAEEPRPESDYDPDEEKDTGGF